MGTVTLLGVESIMVINNTNCSLVLAEKHLLPVIETIRNCFRLDFGDIGEIKLAKRFEVKAFNMEVTTVITIVNAIVTAIIVVDAAVITKATVAFEVVIVTGVVARRAATSG